MPIRAQRHSDVVNASIGQRGDVTIGEVARALDRIVDQLGEGVRVTLSQRGREPVAQLGR